jgi:hypothetical protein
MNAATANRLDPDAVLRYMRSVAADHVIIHTVDATHLAEDACQHFNAFGPPEEYEVPGEFFELAAQVADEYEARQ